MGKRAYASIVALGLALGLGAGGSAMAQFSNNSVKIGVLTDTSSDLSDVTGNGLIAAQFAIGDYGTLMPSAPDSGPFSAAARR